MRAWNSPHPEEVPGPEERVPIEVTYRTHLNFVRRIVRQMGVGDGALEDVVHDVFLVVHHRLADYEGRGSMKSWLFGIARRVVMHHHRSAYRNERRLAVLPEPSQPPGPEDYVARGQAEQLVQEFLECLDEDRRLAFVLVDIEGMRVTEVAASLGINLNTLYARLRSARQAFARHLAQHPAAPGGRNAEP